MAVLHYNENCGRKQAETKSGEKRYAVLYQVQEGRAHSSEGAGRLLLWYVAIPIIIEWRWKGIPPSFPHYHVHCIGYVEKLITQLWKTVENEKSVKQALRVKSPPPLSSGFDQPVKEEAISKHKSRFAQL